MSEQTNGTLADRLAALEKLEREIIRKAHMMVPTGSQLTQVDYFVLGAIKRTVSQSSAFRSLVIGWNFASAAVMVRTQLDTAMRINGIRYMQDSEEDISKIFNGELLFKNARSTKGEKMSDAYLKAKLNEDQPWVAKLYEELSDFVHLSFRHFWPIMAGTDDDNRIAYFAISAEDPKKDETNYLQITDAFLEVSKITGILLVTLLMARHSPPPPPKSSEAGE